jgi:Xaa-Pro dipeptidase
MEGRPLLTDVRSTTRAHRRALIRRLPDGLVLLTAAREILRNGDVHHPYRQSSDFLWLTGVEAPGYALLLDPRRGKETLFVPRLTQKHAVWLGHVPSREEARRRFGIRDVRYADELVEVLRGRGRGRVHADPRGATLVRSYARSLSARTRELREALDELRLFKDAGEIALLAKASAATAAGHLAAMRAARPGVFEYHVQAELERAFKAAGCPQVGYGSIVAGGRNSAVLHYVANDRRLGAGDLLLVDAGAEFRGYTADVTRTFPVSGRFDARQKSLYEIVLTAQERSIDYARAGHTSTDLQRVSERVLAEGLRDLGVLRGSVEELTETEAVRVFYPHGIGHTLGLDVHDVQGGRERRLPLRRGSGRLRFRARLEPGFVITIEPGIYFMPALLGDRRIREKHRSRIDFDRAERWVGVGGVRIEDDVVVRRQGPPRNLTPVPKTVAAVEAACAR